MSQSWFRHGWELDVPNPGYGEVLVTALARGRVQYPGPALVAEDWDIRLVGPDVGGFLVAVTRRAVGLDPEDDGYEYAWSAQGRCTLPEFITPTAAQSLLPILQQAVVLAVAGTDRYDRTFYDDSGGPHEPLCVNCDQGTYYTPGARKSEWCDQHGHAAFGHPSPTWASAQSAYQWARKLWSRKESSR